ncbi:MAG TPA: response regulator transcription factor [Vicinamibacterales bacterium]|nr:response regulator transcription factor [Vicinamibacterales bacterium]
MRVLLVGSARARAKLRARADPSLRIVGEYATIAAARAAGLDADGLLVAPVDDRDGVAEPLWGTRSEADEAVEPLTAREVDVLELLAEGLSNKAIAARLSISDQTVKFHVASILGKLGVHNRTEAVRRAVRRGIVAV